MRIPPKIVKIGELADFNRAVPSTYANQNRRAPIFLPNDFRKNREFSGNTS